MIDLQTERHLEHFLRMLALSYTSIEAKMELRAFPFTMYLEVREKRLLMSVVLPVSGAAGYLPILLGRCQPERTKGLPLRAFALTDRLALSCTLPAGSSAERWLSVYHTQCRLLEQSTRGEK